MENLYDATAVGPGSVVKSSPLLTVEGLTVHFPIRAGLLQRQLGVVRAVEMVSLQVAEGETVGLVGESGCGKTTLGRAIAGLVPSTGGSVCFAGEELVGRSRRSLRRIRRDLQYVFQDPYSSLNPLKRVGDIIAEPLRLQGLYEDRGGKNRIAELLEDVGLAQPLADRFPSELSGGQRQRVSIARALSLEPHLMILDEPVSALDVSVQAQIINLLEDLQERHRLAYLFISHDLGVIRHVADRIMVMYLGKIVEQGNNEAIFAKPGHPYTQALLSAVPAPDPRSTGWRKHVVEGEVPSAAQEVSGCSFHPRCPMAQEKCTVETPSLETRPGLSTLVACHFAGAGGRFTAKGGCDQVDVDGGSAIKTSSR